MRSIYCGAVTLENVGQTQTVCGWVHRRRDHGGVIFVDVRDRSGLLQVVINPSSPEIFTVAEQLRNEYVVKITGTVRPRPEGTVNADLATGQIELVAEEVVILKCCRNPTFYGGSISMRLVKKFVCNIAISICVVLKY